MLSKQWKIGAFWGLTFLLVCCFLQSFAFYLFERQEEAQLFIPKWYFMKEILCSPGGFSTLAALFLVQFYQNSLFASLIISSLLTGIGYLFYRILQTIAQRGYHLLFALIPVCGLIKMHIRFNYVLDGTICLFLMMVCWFVFIQIRKKSGLLIYSIISTIVLYLLAGQIVILYAFLMFLSVFVFSIHKWPYLLVPIAIAVVLTFLDIYYWHAIPVTEGIYSEAYHETQLLPESYMYYVWLRFVLALTCIVASGYVMKRIKWEKRRTKVLVTSAVTFLVVYIAGYCLPDQFDVQNRMADKLLSLKQKKDWNAIIEMHQGKSVNNYISLNFLNMALAEKGVLGDRLFFFDQKSSQGLIADWNRTFYMSEMLSDIHYMLGDLSLSEGYAMEGFSLAKRKGSPRMMQRLVQINLLKGETRLAEKYLNRLADMPFYNAWAMKYKGYLDHPESMIGDKEFPSSKIYSSKTPGLLCLITQDSIWKSSVNDSITNQKAFEYLGCSYLLDKRMDDFYTLIDAITQGSHYLPLPDHFQEAVLLLGQKHPDLLQKVEIKPQIAQRFNQFNEHNAMVQNDDNKLFALFQTYGNTFWFYYYHKHLKNEVL